jgi:Domain of unknown function DUF29
MTTEGASPRHHRAHGEATGRLQVTTLYDTDFAAWAQQQAAALRAQAWAALDLNNLIEEVEDLAGRHRDAIEHQLERLLIHLLKYQYQPEERPRRGRGWRVSIASARHEILKVIRRYPSLQAYPAACVADAYPYARRQAALQTDLPLATFPEACPWTIDWVLDENFLPEAAANGR